MKISIEHGSGGKETSDLISDVFTKYFNNSILSKMEDSAVLEGSQIIAMTTDSYVVTPLFFKGGDIGKLAICGTVNDLAMSGAVPMYITCGFIIETGASKEDLIEIAKSMTQAAKEANVTIVAGDTKVIEGNGGIYINTAGVGFIKSEKLDISKNNQQVNNSASNQHINTNSNINHQVEEFVCNYNFNENDMRLQEEPKLQKPFRILSSTSCIPGDLIIVSGNLGDHHATILSARMNIENSISSDCAPLNGITSELMELEIAIRTMRDITRGGLATILNEFAKASNCGVLIRADKIPVDKEVKAFCGILGLDPLYMGNEGKFVLVVAKEDARKALQCIKKNKYGINAGIVGEITEDATNLVIQETLIGGRRVVPMLYGEGLPRIC